MRSAYTLDLYDVERGDWELVGDKALSLARMNRIDGVRVPPGFCVTTKTFREAAAGISELPALLERLAGGEDQKRITALIRKQLQGARAGLRAEAELRNAIGKICEHTPCVLRTSVPAAGSYEQAAGAFMNIRGEETLLRCLRRTWASLFSEEAVREREKNGISHEEAAICVIVQHMVFADASGVISTADWESGNRRVSWIGSQFGMAQPQEIGVGTDGVDRFRVRDGEILEKHIAIKSGAYKAERPGPPMLYELSPERAREPSINDATAIALEGAGRRIESLFYAPQEIEWSLAEGEINIIKTRPIANLYPLPPKPMDNRLHLYISLSHLLMMTDAMRPLGASFYSALAQNFTEIVTAGGRLYADISGDMRDVASRNLLLSVLRFTDKQSYQILSQADKLSSLRRRLSTSGSLTGGILRRLISIAAKTLKLYNRDDYEAPARCLAEHEAEQAARERRFAGLWGRRLFEEIFKDLKELANGLTQGDTINLLALSGYSHRWILSRAGRSRRRSEGAERALTRSARIGAATELAVSLLVLADFISQYPQVRGYIESVAARSEPLARDEFWRGFSGLEGGEEALLALGEFLTRHGARGGGELDITRSRWQEDPVLLVPALASQMQEGRCTGLDRLRVKALCGELHERSWRKRARAPLAWHKRRVTAARRMFDTWCAVSDFHEYPKIFVMRAFFTYKKALLKEAEILLDKGVIKRLDDVDYLTLEEFEEAVLSGAVNMGTISYRRERHALNERLVPPRFMTSEGEILRLPQPQEAHPKELWGVPAAAGVAAGRARILLEPDQLCSEGEVVIAPYADPGWTAALLGVKALVTEVGGRMTYGATIARACGIPAVAGIDAATSRIKNGARVEVDGSAGVVRIID